MYLAIFAVRIYWLYKVRVGTDNSSWKKETREHETLRVQVGLHAWTGPGDRNRR